MILFIYVLFQTLFIISYSVQFSSVAWLCPALCNPVDCSMTGLPVHHQLPESVLNILGRTDSEAETPIIWPPDEKN